MDSNHQTSKLTQPAIYIKKVFGVNSHSYSFSCSNDDYHRDRLAVSRSQLREILRSPAHFKEALLATKEPTPAQLLGTLVHLAVLEPKEFEMRIISWNGSKNSMAYKRFAHENSHKKTIDHDLYNQVCRMRDAIWKTQLPFNLDSTLKELFQYGEPEKTIFWTDEETGVICRIRVDLLLPNLILDIKTCGDARPDSFLHLMAVKQELDLQAAMYHEGVKAFTGKDLHFDFVAVEDSGPHGVWIHETGPGTDFFENGLRKFRSALRTLAKARKDDCFNSYSGGYSVLSSMPKAALFFG